MEAIKRGDLTVARGEDSETKTPIARRRNLNPENQSGGFGWKENLVRRRLKTARGLEHHQRHVGLCLWRARPLLERGLLLLLSALLRRLLAEFSVQLGNPKEIQPPGENSEEYRRAEADHERGGKPSRTGREGGFLPGRRSQQAALGRVSNTGDEALDGLKLLEALAAGEKVLLEGLALLGRELIAGVALDDVFVFDLPMRHRHN
jgi:hypothetical protein